MSQYSNKKIDSSAKSVLVRYDLPFDLDYLSKVNIVDSSKDVSKGDIVFISSKEKEKCSKYVTESVNKEASYIFVPINLGFNNEKVYLKNNLQTILGEITSLRYPDYKEKNIFGVTGTNGKTTTCQFINILLGTNESEFIGTTKGEEISTVTQMPILTTPTFLPLVKYIDNKKHVSNFIIEVSSHSLEQNRLNDLKFKQTSFTNLSQDHLDFHLSIEDYFLAKKKLFQPDTTEFAIVFSNEWGKKLINGLEVDYVTVGFESSDFATFNIHDQNNSYTTGTLRIDDQKYDLSLPISGPGTIENFLLAITNVYFSSDNFDENLDNINNLKLPDGRYQLIEHSNKNIIIDYAHTPTALAELLNFAKKNYSNTTVLFGCGGKRDSSKRNKMGEAAEIADAIILTSDNPRDENPEKIIEAILSGITQKEKVSIIVDRNDAIKQAVKKCKNEEVLIIAGRGHELYQEINGKFLPFKDADLVYEILKGEE